VTSSCTLFEFEVRRTRNGAYPQLPASSTFSSDRQAWGNEMETAEPTFGKPAAL
jgi:hypothetical protein